MASDSTNTTTDLNPFHLAIPVHDLSAARHFYGEVLACPEGRSSDCWIDFNLFGHQLVVHLDSQHQAPSTVNPVDGEKVPIPHFGVVLSLEDWRQFRARIEGRIEFIIKPQVRFAGQTGEQATMFFRDPSGNALEFKAFQNIEAALFARD